MSKLQSSKEERAGERRAVLGKAAEPNGHALKNRVELFAVLLTDLMDITEFWNLLETAGVQATLCKAQFSGSVNIDILHLARLSAWNARKLLGNDLYTAGAFTTAGGKVSPYYG